MKIKKSIYIPAALMLYLIAMAYIGRDIFQRGEYAYYFSILGLSLVIIVLLHFSLRRKERKQEQKRTRHDSN